MTDKQAQCPSISPLREYPEQRFRFRCVLFEEHDKDHKDCFDREFTNTAKIINTATVK